MKLAYGVVTLALVAGCASAPPEEVAERVGDTVNTPVWAERAPSAADFLEIYPPQALRMAVESTVRLQCTVRDDRRLDCAAISEEVPDMGFGPAGVEVSRLFVVKADYSPDVQPGKTVIVPIRFVVPK